MADVEVKTQVIDRDELAKIVPLKNFRLIKFFENLADDVSTTLPEAIGETVSGPNGAVDGDVVVFDGVTGKAVRDSGKHISALALLDSPVFTGTPQAPTAPPGTNTAQIATTAFVASATTGTVSGPGVSVNNRIALFNGVTGKVIKDSGVLMADVALLDSPALTGNPTAPTAALNDNDTSIATTAFVQAQVASLNAAYFSAHNNAVAQSIPNAALTKLTFSTEQFDVGSLFAGSTWTPPARLVTLIGNVTLPTAIGSSMYLSIVKNGVEFKRGTQLVSSAASAEAAHVSCVDVANGTDTYELWCFQSTGAAQNTFANSYLTYFQGMTVRP